jgi:hypothetical protein
MAEAPYLLPTLVEFPKARSIGVHNRAQGEVREALVSTSMLVISPFGQP